MQINSSLSKLNLEPTAKGSVLKFDKIIYTKSINSEWGDKPPFLGLDKDIIVRFYSMSFRFAQGVQSSLTLGRNIQLENKLTIFQWYLSYGTDRQGSVPHNSICSPILFTQASHTRLPYGRRGVGLGELARL